MSTKMMTKEEVEYWTGVSEQITEHIYQVALKAWSQQGRWDFIIELENQINDKGVTIASELVVGVPYGVRVVE